MSSKGAIMNKYKDINSYYDYIKADYLFSLICDDR